MIVNKEVVVKTRIDRIIKSSNDKKLSNNELYDGIKEFMEILESSNEDKFEVKVQIKKFDFMHLRIRKDKLIYIVHTKNNPYYQCRNELTREEDVLEHRKNPYVQSYHDIKDLINDDEENIMQGYKSVFLKLCKELYQIKKSKICFGECR